MECQVCSLRYNLSERQPFVLQCGHSVCKACLDKITKCQFQNCECPTHISKINYSLIEIIKKDKKNIDKFIKVCFIGSTHVGKTSLIRMLMQQAFVSELPTTIGYDFSFTDRKIENLLVRFQLWDSAGQQKFKAISPIHYKNADILMIVYDMNQRPQQNKLLYWLNEADKHCQPLPEILIIGNKLDLVEGKVTKPFEDQVWNQIKAKNYKHLQISCKCKINEKQVWNALEDWFHTNSVTYKKKVQLQKGPISLVRQRVPKRQIIKSQCC